MSNQEPTEKDIQTAIEVSQELQRSDSLCICESDGRTFVLIDANGIDAIARALSQARQEERERCAGIAEAQVEDQSCCDIMAVTIAAAIRAGEERGA